MSTPRKSIHSAEYIAIVERLVGTRKSLKMTQTELGERFGENQAFISSLERRQRRIDMWEFVRLCHALGVQPSEILDPLYESLSRQ